MASVRVFLSDVSHGSMSNRHDHSDPVVIENRRRWLDTQGIDMKAVVRVRVSYDTDDYCQYHIVDGTDKGHGMTDITTIPRADALVTTTPGLALFLPVADCIATTLYDPEHGVLMLSHLGRQSLEQEGGVKSVAFLQEHYGTRPEVVQVWTSPSVNKDLYPIFKLDNKGMKEVFFEQMDKAGVLREHITDHPADTATDANYFSYSEFLKGNKPEDGGHAMVAVIEA